MSTHLILPDSHAHPDFHNKRFDLVGRLLYDLQPDVFVDMGDGADMPSLCDYDRGKIGFEGRRYARDIAASQDADDRKFHWVRKHKKKMPTRYRLIGNHEYRICRAASRMAEFDGVIGLHDLELGRNFDVVVDYDGASPGTVEIDGVTYAHYLSNPMGKAIGGMHHAHQLLMKKHVSCTVAHSHFLDYKVHARPDGQKIQGLVAGVFQDYFSDYAGTNNRDWWSGVTIKRGVNKGTYDPEFVSFKRLREIYG